MTKFQEALEKNLDRMELYVPVVERVHWSAHPEFHGVRKLFEDIAGRSRKGEEDFSREFELLRGITNNYNVPCDVCETFEAVYEMLAELDQAYQDQDQ